MMSPLHVSKDCDSEGMPMLPAYQPPEWHAGDRALFDRLVPFDHWTRRAEQHVDFVSLRSSIEPLFGEGGRPAVEPVLFLKLELLMFHDNLSDTQVFERAKTDLAYRRFLGLGSHDHLPDVSTLGRFRARLGVEGHQQVFHALLAQARGHGLVKDRLRIKDATHVLADIAVPAGLQLVAAARNKLLSAAEPFDPERVAGERVRIEAIRVASDSQNLDAKLAARVEHLRDILAWTTELVPPQDAETNRPWQALQHAIHIARKVLGGHDQPQAGERIRSTVDPDARRGRHGEFYDGYFVDVLIDADSELFTAVNVLPADGNESADTLTLLAQEQSAHGNEIERISIDGAGFDGPVIRQVQEQGTTVFVPPKEPTNQGRFTTRDFQFSPDGSHATCPAGERSQYKQRHNDVHATAYRFPQEACAACPLQARCIDPHQKHPRTVRLNDYEPEYQALRELVATTEYAAVKREHPKVERRLGQIVNRYGGRRARYRGLPRVRLQKFLEATVHNIVRMIRLLDNTSALAPE
jgi:transposase